MSFIPLWRRQHSRPHSTWCTCTIDLWHHYYRVTSLEPHLPTIPCDVHITLMHPMTPTSHHYLQCQQNHPLHTPAKPHPLMSAKQNTYADTHAWVPTCTHIHSDTHTANKYAAYLSFKQLLSGHTDSMFEVDSTITKLQIISPFVYKTQLISHRAEGKWTNNSQNSTPHCRLKCSQKDWLPKISQPTLPERVYLWRHHFKVRTEPRLFCGPGFLIRLLWNSCA